MGRGLKGRSPIHRLERLEVHLTARIQTTTATAFDLARLTTAECEELDGLTGKLRQKPNGRWDFAALDDAQLERLAVLVAKGQAVE